MSTLTSINIKRVAKYVAYFFIVLFSLYVVPIILSFVFNLGTYVGTFMRCLYAFISK